MEDITKLSEEQLQQKSSELAYRIRLHAANQNLKDALWALIHAVGRLLDDKYSEGDAAVRKQLWTAMHRTADEAREYLQKMESDNKPENTTPVNNR